MWDRAVRGFVITSMVLNGALTIALITAMAAGVRPITVLDLAACVGLFFGFLNAIGDLIEAHRPVDEAADVAPQGATLHIIRQRGEIGGAEGSERETIRLEGLESFRSER
jgi:hypothetical protein